MEEARETLARFLRMHPKDLLFTGSATEANHLALSGATSIVTSRIEHPSIVRQVEYLRTLGRPVEFAHVEPGGRVSIDSIHDCFVTLQKAERLGGKPLLALMAANHETGVLQPLEKARTLADQFGADLHVDGVQIIGRGDVGPLLLADSISVAAHKIRGPKGIGLLAIRCGRSPKPLAYGGAQERGLRPGTQDAALAAGFAAAFRELDDLRRGFEATSSLRDALLTWVVESGGVVHGEGDRLAHVANFRVPGWKGDELVAALDLEGVSISAGSACSAGTAELSPGIVAMLGPEAAEGAVRVSFGPDSSPRDLEELLGALGRLVRRAG
jgi:cysteine desulfurase